MAASGPLSVDEDGSTIQLLRKSILLLAAIAGLGAFAFVAPRFPPGHPAHDTIVWIGIVLIVACVAGRTWCAVYLAGRKKDQLAVAGPYSVSRNPLYIFSSLGAAGIGMQTGSVTIALAAGLITALLFHLVTLQEERYLGRRHGVVFRDYCAHVPRYGPRVAQWQNREPPPIHWRHVWRTFHDACAFLLAIPLGILAGYLHESGALPVLLRLP